MQHRFSKNILHSILYVALSCMLALPVQAADQEAIAWGDLNKYEQLALQSLESNWAELEPEQQKQFQIAAERMLTRSIARESFNRDRVRRWSRFSHDRREHMRKRYRHYRGIDPDERKKMHDARKRFENLSEEEKMEIHERWESTPADQRPKFGPPGHRRPHSGRRPPPGQMEGRRNFEKLSEEEKQEWREMRKERGKEREAQREERRDEWREAREEQGNNHKHRELHDSNNSPEQPESDSLED